MNTQPNHTVLIISDDSAAAATREMLFRERNCAVLTEPSADHAIKAAHLLSPSLLILDLKLPHHERVSLCQKLRPVTNGRILVLSPGDDQQRIYEYYLAGVDEHLSTPLSPLLLVVKSIAWLMRNDWMDIPTQPGRLYS
ncbi:MAG: response regulator [Chloroflexota bacterium]